MKDIKGYRLLVNLGASQTRRRLKGQGHGVRKVYSDGRNRAMIIHTATGGHRQALYTLFHDVIAGTPEMEEAAWRDEAAPHEVDGPETEPRP